jgi:lipopolysaccharide export system ATP-binding protein
MSGVRLLEASGIAKSYHRRRVVDGVDLTVDRGEIVGLLGPNGAGKTTTFYIIGGLIRPDAGRVYLDGRDITRLAMYKRARLGIGYLAQEPSVFRKLTVEDNLLAILETMPMSASERRARAERLMTDLGLSALAHQMAYTLSGGERRKLEITRALVTRPSMIMLDEPFSGVDPLAVREIQEIIKGLRRDGLGVLVTDHNVRETLAVVDRAYLLYQGRVLCEGASSFLTNDPKSRELYLGPEFRM